jgi:hypothetical protein
MKQIIIDGYKRITKKAAEKLYNNGVTIRICPVNINPVNVWGLFADCNNTEHTKISSDGFNTTVARNKEFETVVNAYRYYNCNHETGYYPAFYVKEV